MKDLPKFSLYGADNPNFDKHVQPTFPLRSWDDLESTEKITILKKVKNSGWLDRSPRSELINTIKHINHKFLVKCPGKSTFANDTRDDYNIFDFVVEDFKDIFLKENSDLVFYMISYYSKMLINLQYYEMAESSQDDKSRESYINTAFERFDKFGNCINYAFEQFAVNLQLTRQGFMPVQEKVITNEVYKPVLGKLIDPKWKTVNLDIETMFQNFSSNKYPEVIQDAHRVVQNFLQVVVSSDSKNSKGEMKDLFRKAKEAKYISPDIFSTKIINVVQESLAASRATQSPAKPIIKDSKKSDALLAMNITIVFLQHVLSNLE
jgi:hypothetical protein